MNPTVRQSIERRIIRRFVRDALSAGYRLSVHDGEEITVRCATHEREVMGALMTTDEDRLYVHRAGESKAFGWVSLVYGNDGTDVISDYTTNLESLMAGATALADKLESVA